MVQYNKERHDIVSGIFLYNYPNVPSVPPYDWLTWLKTIYGISAVTERNTLFVHLLVWDERYSDKFLKELLTAVFDFTIYCQHLILVIPARVTPAKVFEREMTRILAKDTRDINMLQFLYLTDRYRLCPKLKIRRVVEEDNDDVMAIINGESTRLREIYGDYYISEIIRYPQNDCRQLIIGEDADDSATGVMCLNSTIDVDLLNENFELTPYNGLKKYENGNEMLADVVKTTSRGELFQALVSSPRSQEYMQQRFDPTLNDNTSRVIEAARDKPISEKRKESEDNKTPSTIAFSSSQRKYDIQTDCIDAGTSIQTFEPRKHKTHFDHFLESNVLSPNDSQFTSLNDQLSVSDYSDMYFQSKMRTIVFTDVMFESLNQGRSALSTAKDNRERVQSHPVRDLLPMHPTYHGETNVFVLEIFAMRNGIKSHWPHDFLEAAFDCFPHLEYCAILLPSSHSCYQFLQHFVRVPLRCNKDFPMTLYIVHRAVLREEIKCRRAQIQDRKAIEELLFAMPTRHEILADFDFAMNPLQLDLDCFAFECNNTMLGLAILCAEKQVNFTTSHYHVEDYVSTQNISQDDYGRLLHFVLMPIFSAYHCFFFREIARLSELTVIFYRLHQEDESALTHSLVSCLDDMIPVNPRRQAEYKFPIILRNLDNCEDNITDARDDGNNDRFSLFMTSPRLAMIPRVIIDTKIIVVGASDCGIAFVEYLALRSMQHYIKFTNLTLISPHGVPFDNKSNHAVACLLPFRGRFCLEYRRCVAVGAWVNIVYGTMIAINRRKKYVTVTNQGNLAYDYLILTCGLQYQKSITLQREKTNGKNKVHYILYIALLRITVENQIPWNCLVINDDTEASTCLKKIRWLTEDNKERKTILFYGRNIDCYCALAGLIESGVKPSWITLIEPSLNPCETHDKVFFHDCEVDKAVVNAILRSGVQVLSEWNVIDWTLTKDNDGNLIIKNITIEKEGEMRRLPCDAFFNFYEKTINLDAFLAFCRAGLVFDGLLVIDLECRTNDPFIFAAGTVTKYSRKFYAESWQHGHYNSVEIGERLAQILRKVIDVRQWDEQVILLSKEDKAYSTLALFRAPTVIVCILPGDYYYLHVRKPGKKILRRTAINHDFYGEVLVTGFCVSEIGYFRIRLNVYDNVETVTCVSRKIFQVQNMITLYGKHESMLNNLKFHFRNSSISDFYAYFCEPWAMAILHDKFECLRVENRATLLSRTDVYGDDSLVDDCTRALIKSKWEAMPEEDRCYIESRYVGSIYHQELENNLVNFLEFCENDLPMYCTRHKKHQMYIDIVESPLYFKQ